MRRCCRVLAADRSHQTLQILLLLCFKKKENKRKNEMNTGIRHVIM